MNSYVHSSIIYNNQGMEATEAPTDIWMYKEDVIHTHTHTHTMGYYLAMEKTNVLMWDKMDEPRGYYAK